jgi:ribosomal protein S18 acetylase RimI-like enzyme
VNFEKMQDGNHRVGCIGFFECIADQSAAFMLFDTAINWLVDNHQITAVDGPVNFGENDKYWGLLISGFTSPSYGMNYNHPFYRKFFETYGFKVQYLQLTNYIDLAAPLPERFTKIAERVINNKHYEFKPFRYKETDHFVDDFLSIYNHAWESFKGFQPMTKAVVRRSLTELKPIMEEDLIWFAYADSKPVGLLLSIPDANEILKYCSGMSDMTDKMKFLVRKYFTRFSRIRVVVMGIVPEFQNRGVESGLILQAYKAAKRKKHYKHVELSWVGDFNQKMIAIHKAMGAVEDKQHATFRKSL